MRCFPTLKIQQIHLNYSGLNKVITLKSHYRKAKKPHSEYSKWGHLSLFNGVTRLKLQKHLVSNFIIGNSNSFGFPFTKFLKLHIFLLTLHQTLLTPQIEVFSFLL